MNESNQVNFFFCYCFKVQNCISWFCDLLAKRQLISLIITIIILEMEIIGFEKKLKRMMDENNSFIFTYIISYFIMGTCNELGDSKGYNSTFLMVITFSVVFSGFSLYGKQSLKNFSTKYLEPLTIATVKFFYFYVMNDLIVLYDKNNADLLSNSMVVSLFIIIYNLIYYVFTDIIFSDQKYERNFILFQFITGICVYVISIFCCFNEEDI